MHQKNGAQIISMSVAECHTEASDDLRIQLERTIRRQCAGVLQGRRVGQLALLETPLSNGDSHHGHAPADGREAILVLSRIFARALLKDAPIVLLDEATASLDVENETKVQGALSRLLAGKTVLVIAHRMRTVEAADKIVVLKDGRVAEQGAPAELRQLDGGIYRHMAELQSASAGWKL